MRYFYDTNILLEGDQSFYLNTKQPFYISNISLQELENIKISNTKDEHIKYKARKIINWLVSNLQTNKYEVVIYNNLNPFFNNIDSINADAKIISCAMSLARKDLIFVTSDLSCGILAKSAGLNIEIPSQKEQEEYLGYRNVYCNSDQQLGLFYNDLLSNELDINMNINEYLFVYDKNKILVDKYRYIGDNTYSRVNFTIANSKMFGKVKPIDKYQELAMDSLKNNQLTLIKGAAGTGKSLLSLAFLFKKLEEGQIDRIIIFCNTVATAGSARLGYYPGDRTEKLLDSQIGNFLISKLGAREEVERLIDIGQLILLPMSDIRGFDTSGMRAGVYITEAQNLNIELMKLALQRIGEDSICILDGDNEAQVDLNLYAGKNNGLKRVSQVFRGQSFYGEVTLKTIHRSRISQIANEM